MGSDRGKQRERREGRRVGYSGMLQSEVVERLNE